MPATSDRHQRSPDRPGIDAYFVYYDAPLATFEQLLRVHPASHLERIKRSSPELAWYTSIPIPR
jgi:acetoin utilization deacetylase AcuC-like enzyme